MALYDSIANDYLLNEARSVAWQSQIDHDNALAWGDWLLTRLINREGELYGERYARLQMQQQMYDLLGDQVLPGLESLQVQMNSIEQAVAGELGKFKPGRQLPSQTFYESLQKRRVLDAPKTVIVDAQAYKRRLLRERQEAQETSKDLQAAQARIRELEAQLSGRNTAVADLQARLAGMQETIERQEKAQAAGKQVINGLNVILADHRWKLLRQSALAAALARDLKKVEPLNPLLTKAGQAQLGMIAELQYKRQHWRNLGVYDTDAIVAEGQKYGAEFQMRETPASAKFLGILGRMDQKQASGGSAVTADDSVATAPATTASATHLAEEADALHAGALAGEDSEPEVSQAGPAHSDNDEHDDPPAEAGEGDHEHDGTGADGS